MAQPPVPWQYRGPGYYTPPGTNAQNPHDVHDAQDAMPGYTDAHRAGVGGFRDANLGGDPSPKNMLGPGHIKSTQAMLARLGYAVDVDGKRGPQTEAAYKAFMKGIPGAYWSRHAPRSNSFVHPGGDPSSTVKPTPDRGFRDANLGHGHTAPPVDPIQAQIAALIQGWGIGDAGAAARAEMNAKYNPQINALNRLGQQNTQQGNQNLADLTNWYKQLESARAAGATADANVGKSSVSGMNAATQGIMGALGGGANQAAGEIGATGDDQVGMLQGLAANNKSFDSQMQGILAAQGVDAKTAQQHETANNASDLAAKLADMRAQKGNDLVSQTYANQGQNNQARAAKIQALIAQGMLPAQIATANADATTAGAKAAIYMQQARQIGQDSGRMGVPRWQSAKGLAARNDMASKFIPQAVQQVEATGAKSAHEIWAKVADQLKSATGGFWDAQQYPWIGQWLKKQLILQGVKFKTQ